MNASALDTREQVRLTTPEPLLAKRRGLVVEDDPFSRHLFTKILSDNFKELEVVSCQDFDSAAQLLERDPFDLLILDIFLGNEKNGVDLFMRSRALEPSPVVIMTSALSGEDYKKLFNGRAEAPPYLAKPFQITHCVDLIEALTEEKLQ